MIFCNLSDRYYVSFYQLHNGFIKFIACQWFKKNSINALTFLQGREHKHCNNSYGLPTTGVKAKHSFWK